MAKPGKKDRIEKFPVIAVKTTWGSDHVAIVDRTNNRYVFLPAQSIIINGLVEGFDSDEAEGAIFINTGDNSWYCAREAIMGKDIKELIQRDLDEFAGDF